MVLTSWLRCWSLDNRDGQVERRTRPALRKEPARRRKVRTLSSVPAEVLERREVLSGASLTLAQAQQDVATAQAALDGAIAGYITAIVGLENQLAADFASHQATFDTAAETAIDGFEQSIDSITAAMDAVIAPIEDQYEDDVEQIDNDLQDKLDDADDQFQNDSQGARNTFDAALANIESDLEDAIRDADEDLATTDTTESGILNAVIESEEDDFEADVSSQDSAFNSVAQSEQADFEADEQSNYGGYETTVGDDTSGLQGSYETTIDGLESTRDGTLANFPNTTYDPSVLDPVAISGVITTADLDFQANIAPLLATYELNVGQIEIDYNEDVQNAWDDYSADLETADEERQQRYEDADELYTTTMTGPQNDYTNNMADIVQDFEDDIEAASIARSQAATVAQGIYDSIVGPAEETLTTAIEAANQEYEDWINGVGSNGVTSLLWTRTATIDTSVTPTLITWATSGAVESGNNTIPWAGGNQPTAPQPPIGYVQQGGPITVINGSITTITEKFVNPNPQPPSPSTGLRANRFEMALLARFEAYVAELDALQEIYDTTVSDANDAKIAAINTAHLGYLDDVYGNTTGHTPYGSGSPADVFQTALDGASQAFNGIESGEWQTYTNSVNNYFMTLMSASMNGGMPMPDLAALGGFAQTYLVNSYNASLDYLEVVGAAWVAFVGAERGADSNRDQDVIQAEYDCAVTTENAALAADQGALGAWSGLVQDALTIDADYTIENANQEQTRHQKIADAQQSLQFTINGAAQTRALSLAAADKTYADSEAGAWSTRHQKEATEDKTLTHAQAAAEETRINSYAGADADHAVATSEASETAALKINQAEATRASALAGEENALTTGALGFVTQFASDVADGIDTLYTAYHTGDVDQAAVSTAWQDFTTQAAAAWVSFASGEAAAWMSYVNQTIADWQDMADNIAHAAQDAVANLAPEYQTLIGAIASAGHTDMDRMADALELRNHAVSGAVASATILANGAALTATNSIIGFARTHDDQVVSETSAAFGSILSRSTQFITDMTNNALPFEQQLIGALGGILGSLRGLASTQIKDDLTSTKDIFKSATTTDDAIYTSWADLQTKQAVKYTVDQREGATTANLSDMGNMPPYRVYPYMMYGTYQDDSSYSYLRQSLVTQYLASGTIATPLTAPLVGNFQNAPQQQGSANSIPAPNGTVNPDGDLLAQVGRGAVMTLPKNPGVATDQARLDFLAAIADELRIAVRNKDFYNGMYFTISGRPKFPATADETIIDIMFATKTWTKIGQFANGVVISDIESANHFPGSGVIYFPKERFHHENPVKSLGTLTHESQHRATNPRTILGFGGHRGGLMIPKSGVGTVEENLDDLVDWAKSLYNPEGGPIAPEEAIMPSSLWDEIVQRARERISRG